MPEAFTCAPRVFALSLAAIAFISAQSASAAISSTEIFFPSKAALTVPRVKETFASNVDSPSLSTLMSLTFHDSSSRCLRLKVAPSSLISSSAATGSSVSANNLKLISAVSTRARSSSFLSKTSMLWIVMSLFLSRSKMFMSFRSTLPILTGTPNLFDAVSSAVVNAFFIISVRCELI